MNENRLPIWCKDLIARLRRHNAELTDELRLVAGQSQGPVEVEPMIERGPLMFLPERTVIRFRVNQLDYIDMSVHSAEEEVRIYASRTLDLKLSASNAIGLGVRR